MFSTRDTYCKISINRHTHVQQDTKKLQQVFVIFFKKRAEVALHTVLIQSSSEEFPNFTVKY